ncbi:MAG: Rrf2 family transcriptional regulator [Dehalococcoidia bacterium]|nr:Rrf2 family transcriptional regulator [Dehalococcoidia bacterium]
MQIVLGRRGEYAVRAVLDLARHRDLGRRKAREISEAMAIPPQYLSHIMGPLVKRRLVSSVAGRDGGYRLEVAPSAVSLLEVVEAAEGAIESSHCTLRGVPCDWSAPCQLHGAWVEASVAFSDHLRRVTFDSLIAGDRVAPVPEVVR